MRTDAPFIVKRLAPPIGRPNEPRRVATDHQAYSLSAALEWARDRERQHQVLRNHLGTGHGSAHELAYRQDQLTWFDRAAFWVERRGQVATRTKPRRASQEQSI